MRPSRRDVLRDAAAVRGLDEMLRQTWTALPWDRDDPAAFPGRCPDCNYEFTMLGQLAHLQSVHLMSGDDLDAWMVDIHPPI